MAVWLVDQIEKTFKLLCMGMLRKTSKEWKKADRKRQWEPV